MFNDFVNNNLTAGVSAMFGVLADYHPLTGDPVEGCEVDINHEAELRPDGYDMEIVTIGTTIEAMYADVGSPKRGSTFVIGDDTYKVARVESNDKVFVKVVVNEN